MDVTVNLSKKDIIILNFVLLTRIRSTYIYLLVLFFGSFVYLFIKGELPSSALFDWVFWIIAVVVCCGIVFLFILSYTVLSVFFNINKLKGFLGLHEYKIDPNGLYEKTDVNSAFHAWEGIHRIIKTNRILFFLLTKSSGHAIPMKSFKNPTEYDDFFKTANEYYWNKVKSGIK